MPAAAPRPVTSAGAPGAARAPGADACAARAARRGRGPGRRDHGRAWAAHACRRPRAGRRDAGRGPCSESGFLLAEARGHRDKARERETAARTEAERIAAHRNQSEADLDARRRRLDQAELEPPGVGRPWASRGRRVQTRGRLRGQGGRAGSPIAPAGRARDQRRARLSRRAEAGVRTGGGRGGPAPRGARPARGRDRGAPRQGRGGGPRQSGRARGELGAAGRGAHVARGRGAPYLRRGHGTGAPARAGKAPRGAASRARASRVRMARRARPARRGPRCPRDRARRSTSSPRPEGARAPRRAAGSRHGPVAAR